MLRWGCRSFAPLSITGRLLTSPAKVSLNTRACWRPLSLQQTSQIGLAKVVGPWKCNEPMTDKTSTSENQNSRRVLVADDDPAILRLVKTILEKENYLVV